MANILIVEDDPDISWLLRELITSLGHEVWTAADGQAGIDRITQCKPDLVVTDIEMPIMSGEKMAQQLILRNCGLELIPVVLISGFPDISKVAATVGTDYYLSKPFEVSVLVRLIQRALTEKRASTLRKLA